MKHQEDQPYIITKRTVVVTERFYNKNYGDDKECRCGHPYHRHFDSYENMQAIGCKYCECRTFVPPIPTT